MGLGELKYTAKTLGQTKNKGKDQQGHVGGGGGGVGGNNMEATIKRKGRSW